MGDVVLIGCITKLDLDADLVLKAALDKGLGSVVILGYDADGDEYFSSSIADGGSVLWLMERLKKQLLEASV